MDRAELRRFRIDVNGISTAVVEAGPADSSNAAVFVHGNPGSSEDWVDLIARTGVHGRALAFDMVGFGKSGKPVDFQYTPIKIAEFLAAGLEQLGVSTAQMICHDFGGPFTLLHAVKFPDRVGSITFINTGMMPGYKWHRMARIWRTPVIGELFQLITTRRALKFSLNRDNPRPLPDVFVDRMYDDYDKRTRKVVLELYRATDPETLAGMLQQVASDDAAKTFEKPVLVIWGSEDVYLPVRYADITGEATNAEQVLKMEGLGHWPFIEDPDGVAATLVPFLARQLSGSQASVVS